jgi:hypothetical protein
VRRVVRKVASVLAEDGLARRHLSFIADELEQRVAQGVRHAGNLSRVRRLPDERARLERAKARLDRLSLYPQPVSLDRVHVVVAPRFFRLPGFGRYRGYALWRTIVVREWTASDDLLTHELCHVWQAQHRPLVQLLAWARYPYRENPFEQEARAAVDATRV